MSQGAWSFIGVDAGGTSTHAVHLSRGGQLVRVHAAGPANPYVGKDASIATLARVIDAVRGDAPGAGPEVRGIVITVALSGGDSPPLCRDYEHRLGARLRFPHVLQVVHDALAPAALLLEMRLAGDSGDSGDGSGGGVTEALRPARVGTLIAGTGSVAVLARTAGGGGGRPLVLRYERRSGGWGPVVSDRGSAHFLATSAIALALEVLDGMVALPTSGALQLLSEAHAHFCGKQQTAAEQVSSLVRKMERLERARLASFARSVSRLAEAGNAVARRALRSAGTELARLLCGVLDSPDEKIPAVAFLATGGVFGAWNGDSSLAEGFQQGMKPSGVQWKLMRAKGRVCSVPVAGDGGGMEEVTTDLYSGCIGAARLSALAVRDWGSFTGAMELVELEMMQQADCVKDEESAL